MLFRYSVKTKPVGTVRFKAEMLSIADGGLYYQRERDKGERNHDNQNFYRFCF